MRVRLGVLGLAAIGLLAGCADVVDGNGALGGVPGHSGASSTPDFPGQTGAPSGSASASAPSLSPGGSASGTAAPPTPCPHVTFAAAKLAFDCLGSGFRADTGGSIWPLRESKTVESATGWVVEEGAGHWGATDGHSLAAIATNVRGQMADAGGYGDAPTITTLADDDTTVDGADAHLLHTRFTLNPTWAKSRKTAVKQEQLWILAIKVGSDDVSLWYTSIPDLVKDLWAKVPSIIKSIKVG
ncbi:MAG: hypothetical protein ABR571_06460 [Jatrophihabitans sp.]|uniref:hypothetical protein n=1 Tax=Jatrophihabitans sp. TaxID=1932789 RepID=UPI003913E8D0